MKQSKTNPEVAEVMGEVRFHIKNAFYLGATQMEVFYNRPKYIFLRLFKPTRWKVLLASEQIRLVINLMKDEATHEK